MAVEHESDPPSSLPGAAPPAPLDEPGVLGVDHVGIAVPDLDQAVAFHVDTLGLRELHREENPVMGVAEAMLGASETGTGVTLIQLLSPLSPTSPITRFLDRAGPGIQHLAYRVRNVDDAARVLRKKGLRLLYDAAKPGTRGSRINFVHPKDAGGVLIELVEPAPVVAQGPGVESASESATRATIEPSDPGARGLESSPSRARTTARMTGSKHDR